MKPLLKVGVVGLGVGEQHARAFHAHASCQLKCIYDIDVERAQQLAAKLKGCSVAVDFHSLLNQVDIVAIASFDDCHYEQVMAALVAGKHVFVEKPVCRTTAELKAIKSIWLASGGNLKLRSNLILRTAPLYVWLKKRIVSGELGRIYSFDGDYLYGRLHKITKGWRSKVVDYSVLQGGGIHLADLMLWLTGEYPQTVTAAGNRLCTEGTAFQYHDYVTTTFEFSSGMIARITSNYGCVHRHHHMMRVFGTHATFLYDDQGPRWHGSRDPDVTEDRIDFSPLPANKGDLIPSFITAIMDNYDDQVETQGFFDGISVCIAADRALATGNKERIDYV
jgi:predicted dehydrogenase